MLQATRTRQAMTIRAKNAKAVPTAMKTVSCGKLDFRIYGALAVGGTVGAG